MHATHPIIIFTLHSCTKYGLRARHYPVEYSVGVYANTVEINDVDDLVNT